jgi:hypothetical protein
LQFYKLFKLFNFLQEFIYVVHLNIKIDF